MHIRFEWIETQPTWTEFPLSPVVHSPTCDPQAMCALASPGAGRGLATAPLQAPKPWGSHQQLLPPPVSYVQVGPVLLVLQGQEQPALREPGPS